MVQVIKSNCLICKKRKKCPNYQFGGLFSNSNCDQFKEEKPLSEEEQVQMEAPLQNDDPADTLISRLMNAAKGYTVWDYGFLKLSLFSAGLLAGAYFAPFILNYTPLLWTIFALSFIWIGYRTFFAHMRD